MQDKRISHVFFGIDFARSSYIIINAPPWTSPSHVQQIRFCSDQLVYGWRSFRGEGWLQGLASVDLIMRIAGSFLKREGAELQG